MTPFVTVVIQDAVEAAAAMQKCVRGWTCCKNIITVDPQSESVSFEQNSHCIIFSARGTPVVDFVAISDLCGLPLPFVDVHQAQEVPSATQHREQFSGCVEKLKIQGNVFSFTYLGPPPPSPPLFFFFPFQAAAEAASRALTGNSSRAVSVFLSGVRCVVSLLYFCNVLSRSAVMV